MQYDDVLKKIGEFGIYQKRVFFILCLQPITSGLMLLISLFTMATPAHRCAIPGYENDTYHIHSDYHGYLINQSIPQSSACYLRNTTADEYGNMTSVEYKCSSWVYDTSTFTSTFVTEFNMVCDDAVMKSNAVMALFLGLLVGYGLLGHVADLFGRKPLMVVSNFVFVISAYLLVWSPNYLFLLITRLTVGLGLSGQALTVYVIGLEMVGPSKRRYTGIIANFAWALGLFVISLFGYLIRNWRYLHLAVAVFSSYLLFFVLLIPESPRWLLIKGRTAEAKKIINKVAKVNGKYIDESLIDSVRVGETASRPKFWKLCSTLRSTITTFVTYFMWFAMCIIYYGIMLNLDALVGDIYLNLCLFTVLEIISYVLVLIFIERIGRKRLVCLFLLLAAVSLISVVFVLLFASRDQKWLMTLFTLIGQFGANAAFIIIWLWTGELFPTELRNVGVGTSSAVGRIGSLLAPYLIAMGDLFDGRLQESSPFILYCIVCVLALILIIIFLPETSRQKLPDTVVDSDRQTQRTDKESNGNFDKELDAAMIDTNT